MAVIDHVSGAVGDAQEGDRLLIDAPVAEHAEGHGQLHRGDAAGAQGEAEGRCVDVVAVHTHAHEEIHRTVHAHHGQERLRRRDVVAALHAGAQGLGAHVVASAVVLGPGVLAVRAGPPGDGHGDVVDDAGGGIAHLQGGRIDGDGLDGGADGHLHVRGAVKGLSGGRSRARTHDGLQLARAVVQNHRRGLGLDDFVIGAVVVEGAVDLVAGVAQSGVLVPGFQRFLHDFLNLGVDGQRDMIAAGAQLVFHLAAVFAGVLQAVELKEAVHDVLHGVFHVMGVVVHPVALGGGGLQHMRRGGVQRLLVLLMGDELVFIHAAQHIIRAIVGKRLVVGGVGGAGVEVAAGIIVVRVVGQTCEHGALAQGQLTQFLAEIPLRRHLHAVVVFAQVDGVEVVLQNLQLGVLGFQLHGQVGLLDLALVAELVAQHRVFDELLGDGRAALLGAGDEVLDKGADDALDVDAVVGIKARILHGDKSVAQILRHEGDVDHDAVFGALVVGDDVALRVVEKAGLVLVVQKGQVQRGRGFHIALGNAHHRARQRQTAQHDQQRRQAHSVDQHRQHKIGLGQPGLEYGAFAGRLLRQAVGDILLPAFLVRLAAALRVGLIGFVGIVQGVPSRKTLALLRPIITYPARRRQIGAVTIAGRRVFFDLLRIRMQRGGIEVTACAHRKRGWLRWLLIAGLLLAAGLIAMEQNLSQTMLDMAFARAYSMAVETINRAVKEVTAQGITYEELIDAQTDAQGRISMLRANTMRMNELAARTALLAEEELNSAENQFVEIPLGAALGVRFLSGFGPRLEVQILPVGAVHTSFDTEFETAGINQTRHKIFLNLRATVSLIVPTGSQLVEVTSTVPIAESIIVGEVPDSFVDVNNEEDMLNLIP